MAFMKFLAVLLQPYPGEVIFPSDFSLDESVARLQRMLVPKAPAGSGGREGCVGSVSAKYVSLEYQHPHYWNSFAPRFFGKFEDTAGCVRLSGGFEMSGIVDIFRAFAFLFCLCWAGGAIYAVSKQEVELSEAIIVLCAGGLVLSFIVLILYTAQSAGKTEEQRIRQIIQRQLGAED